jgi:hypothetical protein
MNYLFVENFFEGGRNSGMARVGADYVRLVCFKTLESPLKLPTKFRPKLLKKFE